MSIYAVGFEDLIKEIESAFKSSDLVKKVEIEHIKNPLKS